MVAIGLSFFNPPQPIQHSKFVLLAHMLLEGVKTEKDR